MSQAARSTPPQRIEPPRVRHDCPECGSAGISVVGKRNPGVHYRCPNEPCQALWGRMDFDNPPRALLYHHSSGEVQQLLSSVPPPEQ